MHKKAADQRVNKGTAEKKPRKESHQNDRETNRSKDKPNHWEEQDNV